MSLYREMVEFSPSRKGEFAMPANAGIQITFSGSSSKTARFVAERCSGSIILVP